MNPSAREAFPLSSSSSPHVPSDQRGVPIEIPVVQRRAADEGTFVIAAVTLVAEFVTSGSERWVYIGDGENQMLELTEESMRRMISLLGQALGASLPSSRNGSIPR